MRSVPFEMEAGFSQVSGVLREGQDDLIIEYQSKLLGLIRSEIKVVKIPYREIEDVSASSNMFGGKLRVQLRTLRSIGSFPLPKQGVLELKIARKDRQQARSFALGINLAASRFELSDEDDEYVD